MIASETILSPFAFGNLKAQLALASEPNLSSEQCHSLNLASANETTEAITKLLPPSQHPFTVSFTHDVDWLDPYHPYAWIQSTAGLIKNKPRLPFKQLWKRDLFLRNCEQMLQAEQQQNIKSIWCLGAQPTEGMSRYDIRYSSYNPLLKELIALIKQHNQEIGLHSSFNAVNLGNLKMEVDCLQELTGLPVRFHRSHYLYANPAQLYSQLDETNIAFELGWGYPRKVALKQAMPGMFRPLNPSTKALHKVQVVPLMMMDNVLFVQPEATVLHQFSHLLASVQTFKGTVCLLFHPENFLLKPDLWQSFSQIIDICKQHQAALQTPSK